jgi:predicted DsbA family dithiol-disulfide isomerase
MLHIDTWADFACPACYLAKPRIDQAIAASGHADAITVTYRSFELFPDAGSEPFDSFEHVMHKTGGDQAQAARIEEHMAALARAQEQPYAIHHRSPAPSTPTGCSTWPPSTARPASS